MKTTIDTEALNAQFAAWAATRKRAGWHVLNGQYKWVRTPQPYVVVIPPYEPVRTFEASDYHRTWSHYGFIGYVENGQLWVVHCAYDPARKRWEKLSSHRPVGPNSKYAKALNIAR